MNTSVNKQVLYVQYEMYAHADAIRDNELAPQ